MEFIKHKNVHISLLFDLTTFLRKSVFVVAGVAGSANKTNSHCHISHVWSCGNKASVSLS